MKNKIKKFRIRIHLGIVGLLVISIIATAAAILVPWRFMSKKYIGEMVTHLNKEIISGVNKEIEMLFTSAVSTQAVIHDIFSKNIIDVRNKQKRKALYLSMLQKNKNFSWVSFGWPNGDFFGAQRTSKDKLRFVESKWQGKKNKATREIDFYKKKGSTFQHVSRRTLYKYNYYAPQRSWYRNAIKILGHIWTPVYVFSVSKKPGINTAIALEKNKNIVGVISVALELDAISRYLKNLKVGKTGAALIFNTKKELVAFQDPTEITRKSNHKNKLVLSTITESKNDFLRIAATVIKEEKIEITKIKKFTEYTFCDPKNGESHYVSFHKLKQLDWIVCSVIPESDFLGGLKRGVRLLLIVIVVIVIITTLALSFFSKRLLVNPIAKITKQFNFIRQLELDKTKEIPSRIKEINSLSDGVMQMTQGLISFQKYLPTVLVRDMISQGIEAKIGGEEKELTIFFSDLASFTKIFEKEGNKLVMQLEEYFSEMSEIISKNKGSIDKYIGDAIMAFWGAPTPNNNHAVDACRAALHCQHALKLLAPNWEREGKPVLNARIGVNTGRVVVGNLGSSTRLNYTVIGDPVNLSSRLEALNKYYKTGILIGPGTYNKAKDFIVARKVDTVAVYGKTHGADIFELIAMRDEARVTDKFEWISTYEKALQLYKNRQWEKAATLFQKAAAEKSEKDYPSLLFISRCRKFMTNPPDDSWEGVTVMSGK